MDKNYYEEVISEIERLIEEKEFEKAFVKLEIELAVPYVPPKYEKSFKWFMKQVKELRGREELRYRKVPTMEVMEKWLFEDELESQILMVSYLKEERLSPYLDMIKRYLLAPKNRDIRSILIYELIDNRINEEIKTFNEDFEIDFNPFYCELPQSTDFFLLTIDYLQDSIKQNPTALKMACDVLHLVIMHKLPLVFDDDEIEIVGDSIMKYTFEIMETPEEWVKFRDERAINEDILFKIT